MKETKQKKNTKPGTGKMIFIILFWLLVWEILSVITGNAVILSGPVETGKVFFELLFEKDFLLSVVNSFLRITGGFLLASVTGMILGALSYRYHIFSDIVSPFITLLKAIPVASFVIIAIIWLHGTKWLSLFVVFIVDIPAVYTNMIKGLEGADTDLLEMADVFSVGCIKKIENIYIPAVLPYLAACFETAIGMSFKSGVAAELIGQPEFSIGGELYQAKIFLDTPRVFAWTIVVIVLSKLLERLLSKALSKYGK